MIRAYCKSCDKYFKRYLVEKRGFCPECGGYTKKKSFSSHNDPFISKVLGEKCGVDALHVENVRWSEAMGCNPDQIPEFKKKWPWMEFDREGRCRVGSRHEKLRIMKARGFTERG